MSKMTDINYIANVKSCMQIAFEGNNGDILMDFLENTCCWYQSTLVPGDPEMTMVNDGKRQVLSTIKTMMRLTPEQIVALVNNKEA